jgi:hypothetical protein
MTKLMRPLTVVEAGKLGGLAGGRRGGNETKRRHGREHYQRIGRKGGAELARLVALGKKAEKKGGK